MNETELFSTTATFMQSGSRYASVAATDEGLWQNVNNGDEIKTILADDYANESDEDLFAEEELASLPNGPQADVPVGDGVILLTALCAVYVLWKLKKQYKMKHFVVLLCALLGSLQCLWADNPDYSTLNGKRGKELLQAVQTCVRVGYNQGVSYTPGIWDAYCQIDIRPSDGYLWDIYSETNQFVCGGDKQGATIRGVGTSYNREHSIPKSWFGGGTKTGTPGADLMHIFPVDGYINSTHNNLPYGEVDVVAKTFSNSDCKSGTAKPITINNTLLSPNHIGSFTATYAGESKVFEPLDKYKGDLARGYFGTMVMWMNISGDDANAYQPFTAEYGQYVFTATYDSLGGYGFTPYGLALMLKWHRNDDVSRKEMNRNNGVQEIQGNRNPFIDIPVLAEYIWGNKSGEVFNLSNSDVVVTYTGTYSPTDDFDKLAVKWMANGALLEQLQYNAGEALRLPTTTPDGCEDGVKKQFIGWTSIKDYFSPTGERPADLFTSVDGITVTTSMTYYAVYETVSE